MSRVAIVAGRRTPFVKALTHFKDLSALDLAIHAVDGLVSATALAPDAVPAVHFGLVVVDPRIPHMGREVVLRSERLAPTTRAVTITDNCITGTSAVVAVHDAIALGRISAGIAGGVESMSNTAIMVSPSLAAALRDSSSARSTRDKLKAFLGVRPLHLLPTLPGIEEPSTGLSMGEHTELMVKEWGIPRDLQDHIAYRSHIRAAAATEDGRLSAEIVPVQGIDYDTMVRPTTTVEKLAALKPVFDKENGTLTAGNSSPLTDGAAAMLLMSEARAAEEGRDVLAFVADFEHAAIAPEDGLLMAPAVAVPRLLARHQLTLDDIDVVEVHEAFGGQVACNLAAWEQGWKEPAVGTISDEVLNATGGSLAIGHPFAATGIRILTTVAGEMARRGAKTGLVSICAAGGQAAAVLLRRD